MPATNVVKMDEPSYGLAEVNLQSPGSLGFHRYQIIYVIRQDALAEYREDLGPVSGAQQFRVPGGVVDEITGRIEICHTVGELIDIANFLRAGIKPPPDEEPHDLITGYANLVEKSRAAIKHGKHHTKHFTTRGTK